MIPQTDTVPESHLTDAADTFRSRFSHLRKAPAAASIDSSGLSYARPRHIKCDESRLINKSLSWQLISSRSRATQRASWAKPAATCETIRRCVRERPPGSHVHVYVYTQFLFFFCLSFSSPQKSMHVRVQILFYQSRAPLQEASHSSRCGASESRSRHTLHPCNSGESEGGGLADNDAGLLSSCAHSDKVGGDVGGEATNTVRAAHNARCRHVVFLAACLSPQRDSRLIMPRTQIRQVSPRRAGKDKPCGESAETLPTHQVALCVG